MTELEIRQKVNKILDNKELVQDIQMYKDFKKETGCEDMALSEYLKDLKASVINLNNDYDGLRDGYVKGVENIDDKNLSIAKAVSISAIEDREQVKRMVDIVNSDYYAELIESAEILEEAGQFSID